MIRITDKSLCSGCTACVNICPVQCIVMRRDREGFDYPVANHDICIGCGKCDAVCPVLNPGEPVEPLSAMVARSDEYRAESTSGGIFPILAEKVISKGGLVYGAVMNDDMTVGHADASDMAGVQVMRGSKYVQSDLYSVFEEIRDELEGGRQVLFSGTPCQVAGLGSYLGKRYEGLVTVDFACHGVPSPGLWEKYVDALGKTGEGSLESVCFRDKSSSWMHYSFSYVLRGGRKISSPYMKDPYMALFAQDMTLRPSCYDCVCKAGRSGSDLTLADLWSVAQSAPGFNDDRGVSLILANTVKGRDMLDGVKGMAVDADLARMNNGGFRVHSDIPERRAEFFAGLHSAKDIPAYMKSFVIRQSFCKSLRSALSAMKRRLIG